MPSIRSEELFNNNCTKFGHRYFADTVVPTMCDKFIWQKKLLFKINFSYAIRTIS